MYKDKKNIPKEKLVYNGLQVMPLGLALCRVSPTFFEKDPQTAEIALRMIRSSDELIKPLIEYGYGAAAGRLIGAYQFLNDHKMATDIKESLETFISTKNIQNPFTKQIPLIKTRMKSPYAARVIAIWNHCREDVLKLFPKPPK